MIVCKKPWTLYDVDLIGMVGLAVLGLAAWWLILAPWQETWNEYRELAAARSVAQAGLQQDLLELERFEPGLVELEHVLAAEFREVPRAEAFSRLLRQMTSVAEEANLELLNVVPQPAVTKGAYRVSDVQVDGRGRSRDFIRFLDRLALENPYQSLRTCSISRRATGPEPTCNLAWTIRLYLLPTEVESEPGGES
ncbi:MAG: type 4a pilus biogenesis protein PilO [Phycisphaerae bacterium]|nr:type 4a pilus biogenesis protein PilO [Phycisphaerae bacterium]